MRYNDQINLKLFSYKNSAFVLQAIIDDYQEISFSHNIYEAGDFTVTINYNIPNALKFERGMWIQFGDDPYMFGEIITISDAIGQDGKGSQIRTITGFDARYILKRRVIKNMNSNGLWAMTDKGEVVLRSLVYDQCGAGAEAKRQLPITNVIPASADAKGKVYSVSENFTNLYEVCKTIAIQSEIGWAISFNGAVLTLEVYTGTDRSQTVRFDTDYESLANGEFTDSSDAFSNAIYVGGKGQNDDRDIYEGEDVSAGTPSGLDRFESWDNQSSMTVEAEYEAEALSMLSQYGQTLTMSGNGLAKCPYVFREQYDIGDIITVAFSGKSASAQILSVTEHWTWGAYDISFAFGKPQNNLADQLQLMLRKIQEASNKTNSTDSVRWYTIPTDTAMPKADVTYNTIGFVGTVGTGATFTLYLDDEKTGAKTYHVYFKQLGGTGKLTLTTGKAGATNLTLNAGTYVAIIYVDENGNVTNTASTPTATIEAGSTQPATSGGVSSAISSAVGNIDTTKTDANDCYTNDTRISYYRLTSTAQNLPPISNTNYKYGIVESLTFNNGSAIHICQMWYNNADATVNFVYVRNGTGTPNSIVWGSWEKVTNETDLISAFNDGVNILKIKADQYQYSDGKYGIDLQNSDIINFNALWANDYADNTDEGINFIRSNNNYDGIKAFDGKLYFEKNINKTTKTSDGRQEVPTLVKTDASVSNIIKKCYTLNDLKIVLMQATVTYQTKQPSGAIYYALCDSIPFPITFTNKPAISMFTEYNGGNAWCWGASAVTTTETGNYYIARGSNTTVGVVVHIIAIGE